MKLLALLYRRFCSLWRRPTLKREIDEELRFHIERRAAENIAAGLSPEEAAREARKRFGNAQSVREECRDVRGASIGEATLQDVRFGWRMLRKNPGFTTIAVLILALGIGANTVIYSVVNAFLIRPLPYPKSEELVSVYENNLRAGFKQFEVSGPKYLDWREQNPVFQDMGALKVGELNLTGGAEPIHILTLMVSPSYLRVLGVHPHLGRVFAEEEAGQGKNQVVILGHSLWKNRFAARADLIGQTVRFDGQARTVIGVLPPGLAQHRNLHTLAVVEIGLAMVLLVGAGLLVRNLVQLHRVNPGFDPQNVLTMKVSLPGSKYSGDPERTRFFDAALDGVKTVPGVQRAAVSFWACYLPARRAAKVDPMVALRSE